MCPTFPDSITHVGVETAFISVPMDCELSVLNGAFVLNYSSTFSLVYSGAQPQFKRKKCKHMHTHIFLLLPKSSTKFTMKLCLVCPLLED